MSAIYGAEILLALEAVHRQKIMHRDLKPENILIDSTNHLKVIDFGDAKEDTDNSGSQDELGSQRTVEGEDEEFMEKTVSSERRGTFVGTAYYVSPEMLQDSIASSSSDLWALGCIIYRMLIGQVPFQGPNDYMTF